MLTIIPYGDAAAVVLPPAMLASAGLRIGDVLEVTFQDHELTLRASEDAARKQLVEQLTQDLIERRRDAYQRLA